MQAAIKMEDAGYCTILITNSEGYTLHQYFADSLSTLLSDYKVVNCLNSLFRPIA